MNDYITYGLPDDLFIRGNSSITKEEIRILSISKLRLNKNSIVLDIGAGTGSISIEIARILKNGKVYSIEKDKESLQLIKKNKDQFNINNITICEGEAPAILKGITGFNRAFIGGSGGKLNEILKWIDENITEKGRIVVNAIALETLIISRDFFKNNNYINLEIIQAAISRCEQLANHTMLKALNPIFIISAEKE